MISISSSRLVNLAVLTTDRNALAVAIATLSGPDIVPLLNCRAIRSSLFTLERSLMICSIGAAVAAMSDDD